MVALDVLLERVRVTGAATGFSELAVRLRGTLPVLGDPDGGMDESD